ncbi:MAG: DNA adenine methylase [Anaerolineales bacterium]|nr:DNA adenine methylase [Anaerolineales bacterium]
MRRSAFNRLQQRADYTYKYNLRTGRHGWLRLTPAYSVRIVEELLDQTQGHLRVFDPFCGTATTALSAAYHGHDAVTIDINPFLIWLGQAKTRHYTAHAIAQAREACEEALLLVNSGNAGAVSPPPIHNIERWWTPEAVEFLCRLRATIERTLPPESSESVLLRIAFCRTLMACSNAAFNHQSMSFKDTNQLRLIEPDYADSYRNNVAFVLEGARENPKGNTQVILHDARELATLVAEPFDLVITSPPYVNRMSYIRELRPYMYWLRFLTNSREAGELDWLAIGGTWGIATSRLSAWQPEDGAYTSEELDHILDRIAGPTNPNGQLLATYIRKYFADMGKHLAELRAVLKPRAKIHYIVGNSSFYGELLPVERLYASILAELGFRDIHIQPLRKRNSKRELVEFDVSAMFE